MFLKGAWLLLGAGWGVSGAILLLELLFGSSGRRLSAGNHSSTK